MELFDVRLLFSGDVWVSVGTAGWAIILAFLGWRDAVSQRVNLVLCLVVFGWPGVLFAFGVVGFGQYQLAAVVFVLAMVLAFVGVVGWGDVLVVAGVVGVLGMLGMVALAIGLFVALMHALITAREEGLEGIGDWQVPAIAYVSLPVVVMCVLATLAVQL